MRAKILVPTLQGNPCMVSYTRVLQQREGDFHNTVTYKGMLTAEVEL